MYINALSIYSHIAPNHQYGLWEIFICLAKQHWLVVEHDKSLVDGVKKAG